MQILEQQNQTPKDIAIVCCQHGVEIFGLDVFRYFKENLSQFPTIKVVLANEEAVIQQKRFIDEDLNRAFGTNNNTHESLLAKKILSAIGDTKYVLDIHTTTSEMNPTIIVSRLNDGVKKIINTTPYQTIGFMYPPFGEHALTGNVENAIALEFNEKYAKSNPDALNSIIQTVQKLQKNERCDIIARNVYNINRTIPPDNNAISYQKNLVFDQELQCFPFLIGEKYYTDIKGFCASTMEILNI